MRLNIFFMIFLCLVSMLFIQSGYGKAHANQASSIISNGAGTSADAAKLSVNWKRIALYLLLLSCFLLAGGMAWRLYRDITVQSKKSGDSEISRKKAQEMLASLSNGDQQNFGQLRDICSQLQGIAKGMRGETVSSYISGISETHVSGINRLLWIYLKLLYSRKEIDNFFRTIDVGGIEGYVRQTEERLAMLGNETEDDLGRAKRRRSLTDLLKTSMQRLKNYRMVKENHEFISIELERLYLKITSALEMGIHRQSTDDITGEIDAVSTSVVYAEQTIQELEAVIGFSLDEGETPMLLHES